MLVVNIDQSSIYREVKAFDQVLIAIVKDNNIRSVMAEYEVDRIEIQKDWITYHLEPIDIAPPNNGVIMNELVYVKLTTYSNPKQWETALENPITIISSSDFKELTNKLAI